jgi:4-amino-4-deoxy-L-arabinose transferase-like glycosyltransferase
LRPALLLAACGLTLLLGIGAETGVTGQDEYWLTLRTPLEMLAGDHFWTPFLNGEPRLRKPPLIYWLGAGLYALFGIELWAARLIGVLSALGLSACGVLLGRRLGARNPWLIGLVLLGSSGVAIEGRRAMLDLPLAAGIAATLWLGLQLRPIQAGNAAHSGLPRRRTPAGNLGYAAATGAALALTGLIKGPVALLFCAAALLAGLWTFPAARSVARQGRLWLVGLAALLLLAVPWPLSMRLLWPEFSGVMASEAGARRLSFLPIVSPGPVLGGLFGNCVPWSFVLAPALWWALLKPQRLTPVALFFARWCLLGAMPFLFFKSFERYLIPLCLPMAGLIAEQLACGLAARRQLLGASLLLALPALAFGVLAWRFAGAWLPALVLLLALGTACFNAWQRRPLATAFALALVLQLTLGWVYPRIGINRIPAGFERHAGDGPVFCFEGTQPAMLSMRLKRSVQPLNLDATSPAANSRLAAAFKQPGTVYLDALKLADFQRTAEAHAAEWSELERVPALYARKNWIKFARPGATRADWLAAWNSRSLKPLAAELVALRFWPKG